MDASVLIPSYNARDTLLRCLARLERQTLAPARFEVVVVLDGSTDGSEQALAKLQPPFALKVVSQPNAGRAAALNRAAVEASGRVRIITDADILPVPEFLEAHLAGQRDADVNIGPIPLADVSPTDFLTDGVRDWADEHDRRMRDQGGPRNCTEIYGANLSIPRDAFRSIGGYREDLRRTEDFQLGKKILAAGYRVGYLPDAIAAQIYDKTFDAWCADFYQDGRSQVILASEFPEERVHLRLGHYRSVSRSRLLLRTQVVHGRWPGTMLVGAVRWALERARRRGLRWRLFKLCQGMLGDAFYWKGVRDELDDAEAFSNLIGGHA